MSDFKPNYTEPYDHNQIIPSVDLSFKKQPLEQVLEKGAQINITW